MAADSRNWTGPLTEEEKILRGLLQFYACEDARRPASEEIPLRLRYLDLVAVTFGLLEAGTLKAREPVPPAPVEDLSAAGDEDPGKAETPPAAVPEAETSKRPMTEAPGSPADEEAEAKRRRIEARQNRGQQKWNFAGKPPEPPKEPVAPVAPLPPAVAQPSPPASYTAEAAVEAAWTSVEEQGSSRPSSTPSSAAPPTGAPTTAAAKELLLQQLRDKQRALDAEVRELRQKQLQQSLRRPEAAGAHARPPAAAASPAGPGPASARSRDYGAAYSCEIGRLQARRAALQEMRDSLQQEADFAKQEVQRATAALSDRRQEEAQAMRLLQEALLASPIPVISGPETVRSSTK